MKSAGFRNYKSILLILSTGIYLFISNATFEQSKTAGDKTMFQEDQNVPQTDATQTGAEEGTDTGAETPATEAGEGVADGGETTEAGA